MAAEPHRLSDQQWQVVLGSLMGDGNLSPNRRDRNGVRFRLGHGAKQAEYLDWKTVAARATSSTRRRENAKGASVCRLHAAAELGELQRAVYLGDGKKIHLRGVPQGADATGPGHLVHGRRLVHGAVQGTAGAHAGGSGRIEICVEAMSEGSRERLRRLSARHARARCSSARWRGSAARRCSPSRPSRRAKFQELVAPYVHPSMDYKLLPRFRGQFEVTPEFVEPDRATRASAGPRHPREAADPVDAASSTSRSRATTTTSSTG